METTLRIELKDVYGRTLAYPANDQATRLATLIGAKTFSVSVLRDALAMGFKLMLTARGVDLKPVDGGEISTLLS